MSLNTERQGGLLEGKGPLSGVVVVDLTQALAGPYCTLLLADLGARIIKIEPAEGDSTRHLPPYFVKGTSAYFLSVNRTKESVVVDLKRPEGCGIVLDLVRRADVVVENFRPGVLQRLGLSYERLAETNPGIVLCSISGFGQSGPDAGMPAYDAIVQGLSGVMSITGVPGERPVRTGIPIGDLAAGMFGAVGLLAALSEKRLTGRGRHVDVAMLDSQIALLSYLGTYYLVSGEAPGPQGRGHLSIPTYRSFMCRDGIDVMVTANTERMWRELCHAIERAELADEPRFATNEKRFASREALWAILDEAFRQRPAAEWLARLRDRGVPAGPINTVDRALDNAQAKHRNMTLSLADQDGTALRLIGNPIKYADRAEEGGRWPPRLGEHTRSVLTDFIGRSHAEVDAMVGSGIVAETTVKGSVQ